MPYGRAQVQMLALPQSQPLQALLLHNREASVRRMPGIPVWLQEVTSGGIPHPPPIPLSLFPPPPLSCFLSLSLPLLFISILLYTQTSIDTKTTCLQMSKSYDGPRSQHDAKNHALYLPGVAWDLRPAWSHRSPTLGQGTGDCHDPHGLGLSTALKASPLPPLPSPWERVILIIGRDTPRQHRICSPFTEPLSHVLGSWSGRGGGASPNLQACFSDNQEDSAWLPGGLLGLKKTHKWG